MKINFQGVIRKLKENKSTLLDENYLKDDMETIYNFYKEGHDSNPPSNIQRYFILYPDKFDLEEFVIHYFAPYKEGLINYSITDDGWVKLE